MSDTPFYQCPVCDRRSFNPNDIEHRYCGHCRAFEREQSEIITKLLRDAALAASDNLMLARGGIKALSPVQVIEFNKTIGHIDRLITVLENRADDTPELS